MVPDDVDETWYACPCGEGEVYTYFSSPNGTYGKARSSAEIRCPKCRERYRLSTRLMSDVDNAELRATRVGVESVRLGTLRKIRTRSNY